MISQKSIRSCKDKYQIALANWCSLWGTPLIMLSWGVGRGWGLGLPSKSSCINKITRWSMNEFAAGSAFITHASAGSGSTGLYQTSREVTGENPRCWDDVSAQLRKPETGASFQIDHAVDVVFNRMRAQCHWCKAFETKPAVWTICSLETQRVSLLVSWGSKLQKRLCSDPQLL